MSTQAVTPEVAPQIQDAPQISSEQAFAMPLEELKQAAGIDKPQEHWRESWAVPQPQAQEQTAQQPEMFTVSEDGNGITVRMSPGYGGEVFKGKDWAEVGPKIAKAKAHTVAWARGIRNTEPPQFQENPQQTQTTQQAQPQPTDAGIHPNAVVQDGQAAADVLREMISNLPPNVKQQLVAEAFGLQPEQLQPVTQTISGAAAEWQANNLLMEFHRACPDYLDTPENTKALYQEALAGKPQGYLPTLNDLYTGWTVARYKGTGTPHDPKAQAVPQPRPPIMPSANAAGLTGDSNPWSMDMETLRKAAGLK